MSSWLSWRNWVDASASSLTADNDTVGDLSVENLRERQGYKVWRTIGLSEGFTETGFNVDFGKARSVQCLALFFPRINDPNEYDPVDELAATDTVRHRLSAVSANADEAYNSGVLQSGVLPGYGYHVVRLDAPVSCRYWRCDIDAISRAALGWVDVARAWAGPIFEPRVNFSVGDNYGWSGQGEPARASRGISEFPDNIEGLRSWSLSFEGLDAAERTQFIEFERLATNKLQFLVSRDDVDAGMGWMLSRQSQSLGVSSLAHLRNSKAMRIVESL